MVRILVRRKADIVYRIYGRWDIGYEFTEEDGRSTVFVVMSELSELQRFVLKSDAQGMLESQKYWSERRVRNRVWNPLRREMLNNSDWEGIKKEYVKLGSSYFSTMRSRKAEDPVLLGVREV